jgi:hypothetical protein
MANEDIEQKVIITYDTNADKAAKDVDKLDKEIGKTTESTKKAKKATGEQKQGLEDLGGGIGSTISGFKNLIKQMWILVANPVGAVIAAIALGLTVLFKAFTSTKAGAEKFDQVMAGIGATIDVIRDRILKAALAIGRFLIGDFSGAMDTAKEAVSGFGAEVAAEFAAAANATKSLQEVADAMRGLSVSRAELDRDLAESERILTDINATYKEKQTALAEVEKAEKKQTDAELENARKKLAAILLLNEQSDSGSEDLDAAAEAQIAVIELEKQSSENRRKVADFNKTLAGEEQTRIKELTDARKAAAAERAKLAEEEIKQIAAIAKQKLDAETTALRAIQDLNDKTEEEKLSRKKERDLEAIRQLEQQGIDVRNLLIYNDELYNTLEDELREKRAEETAEKEKVARDKALEIKKEQAAKEKEIEDARLAQTQAIEDAKVNILQQGIRLVSSIFGKSKAIQKAAIIAENAVGIGKMVIDNNRANIGALATPQAIASSGASAAPVIAINNITTGLGIASSIAATAKALKSVGGGSGGGGGSASGGGAGRGGASAAPQVGFQSSSENQIATSISDNTNKQPPIEAFVVESKITTSQAAARKRVENNSF